MTRDRMLVCVYSGTLNHGQKSLGQSEGNFNSIRFTSSVAKSSAVFLQIYVPSPLPTQYTMFVHCFVFLILIILISVIYRPASRVFFHLSRKEDGTQVGILCMSFCLID